MKVGLEHHVLCHLELGHSHRVDLDYLLFIIRKATSTKSDSQIIFYSYCRRPFMPHPISFCSDIFLDYWHLHLFQNVGHLLVSFWCKHGSFARTQIPTALEVWSKPCHAQSSIVIIGIIIIIILGWGCLPLVLGSEQPSTPPPAPSFSRRSYWMPPKLVVCMGWTRY